MVRVIGKNPSTLSEYPCLICYQAIYDLDLFVSCQSCDHKYHNNSFIQLLKIKSFCPNCKLHLNRSEFMRKIKNDEIYEKVLNYWRGTNDEVYEKILNYSRRKNHKTSGRKWGTPDKYRNHARKFIWLPLLFL